MEKLDRNRRTGPVPVRLPPSIVLFTGLQMVIACGEAVDHEPGIPSETTTNVDIAPIMPDDTEVDAPVRRSRGSSGDPDQILATIGDLQIDGAQFHSF